MPTAPNSEWHRMSRSPLRQGIGKGWGHQKCAQITAEPDKIRSGATFRAQ
ncbi:hypothetical protein [Amycolatopsis rhizosphaerae]|nr:hypothetical protein [Amycolatopsis rhizosphaerae]